MPTSPFIGDRHEINQSDQHVRWEWQTIGQFTPFKYGKSLPASKRRSKGRVKVFGSNGVVGTHNVALTGGPTIVIGRKGTVGAVHFSQEPCWPIDTTFYIEGDDPETHRFKYYALKQAGLAHMNTDSAVPGLNRSVAHAQQILVPPLADQLAIAHILGTLEDRIELSRRMNATLEEMAKVLFRSWFVNFDPVSAKVEGRWLPGESLPGLPSESYDLFPDHLVDSQIGRIPEGWAVSGIEHLGRVVYGAPFASKNFNSIMRGLPVIRIRDLKTHKPSVFTEEVHRNGHIIDTGDIVIGMDGEFRAYLWEGPIAWLNQRVCHLEPLDEIPHLFAFLSLADPLLLVELQKTGTTVIHLNKSDIEDMRFVLPPPGVLDAVRQVLDGIYEQLRSRALEKRTLTSLRDVLLPKLVGGYMRLGSM